MPVVEAARKLKIRTSVASRWRNDLRTLMQDQYESLDTREWIIQQYKTMFHESMDSYHESMNEVTETEVIRTPIEFDAKGRPTKWQIKAEKEKTRVPRPDTKQKVIAAEVLEKLARMTGVLVPEIQSEGQVKATNILVEVESPEEADAFLNSEGPITAQHLIDTLGEK